MEDIINLHDDDKFPVSGRDLHEKLNTATEYRHWFPRMCEYGFAEKVDFNPVKIERVQTEGGRTVSREVDDHLLTLSMAKELCMLQRTDKGREIRRHLIAVEEQWNTPTAVLARAVKMADQINSDLRGKVLRLEADNSKLTVENQIMEPKAAYFDDLVDKGGNTGIRETAKLLGVKEREFVSLLLDGKYMYRDQKGKLQPYAPYANDLFELKEKHNDKTEWSGTQAMLTPKGREHFYRLTRQ